jgi:hypothetical protein
MTILQSIAIYLLAGTILGAFLDTVNYLIKHNNPEHYDPENELNNWERFVTIIGWPFVAFSIIRELIRISRHK